MITPGNIVGTHDEYSMHLREKKESVLQFSKGIKQHSLELNARAILSRKITVSNQEDTEDIQSGVIIYIVSFIYRLVIIGEYGPSEG